jgi:hypothetical protein
MRAMGVFEQGTLFKEKAKDADPSLAEPAVRSLI